MLMTLIVPPVLATACSRAAEFSGQKRGACKTTRSVNAEGHQYSRTSSCVSCRDEQGAYITTIFILCCVIIQNPQLTDACGHVSEFLALAAQSVQPGSQRPHQRGIAKLILVIMKQLCADPGASCKIL